MTPEFLHKWIIPAGLSLLPNDYNTPEARRLMIAIALQESGCKARRQHGNGPARSYWQFELIGVQGLLMKADKVGTGGRLAEIAMTLGVRAVADEIQAAIEHNDILAAVCARLLIYINPKPLPTTEQAAWEYYLAGWRPGKPKPDSWPANWAKALELIP